MEALISTEEPYEGFSRMLALVDVQLFQLYDWIIDYSFNGRIAQDIIRAMIYHL